MLTSKQRRMLKGLAHPLKPIVLLGNNGLTDAVIEETERALTDHELIKVKLRGSEDREEDAAEIARRTGAELIGIIGLVAIFFRANPDNPGIKLKDD